MPNRAVSNNLVLELHVPEFEPARKFYGLFGFQELSYDAISADGKQLGYLVLARKDPRLGTTLLNFYGDRLEVASHSHFKNFAAATPRGYAIEITIPVSDIEQLWGEVYEKLDPTVISEPLKTKAWGSKDFRLVDPYGFYVRFTGLVDWGQ